MRKIFAVGVGLVLLGPSSAFAMQNWTGNLQIPRDRNLYLVVKGFYRDAASANKVQAFISQLMGTTPPDEVDRSDKYHGLPAGKYLVGTLFDSRERAQWWIDYSYRNRQVPRGEIHSVRVTKDSSLPYLPVAGVGTGKRLISEAEALQKVKQLRDVQRLAKTKPLIYKFTDYPRNGDLRYEIEILESRGRGKDAVMVDFIMVGALDGAITERFSESLGKKIE